MGFDCGLPEVVLEARYRIFRVTGKIDLWSTRGY